jgi:hypothetical protein
MQNLEIISIAGILKLRPDVQLNILVHLIF